MLPAPSMRSRVYSSVYFSSGRACSEWLVFEMHHFVVVVGDREKKGERKEKIGEGKGLGRGRLYKVRHRFDVCHGRILLHGKYSEVTEVFHEAVTLPAEDKFDLGSSEPKYVEDYAGADT
jgi:hypothetical protein